MIAMEEQMEVNDIADIELPLGEEPTFDAPESRYENHSGTFTTGIDIFSKEQRMKMEERAKRFGLTHRLQSCMTNQEQDLYSSMGIIEDNENTKNIRLNVIHMRGTEEMSTKDVFKYFEDYAPASIEWINDVSCNVVWLDNVSAARALLGLSKRIIGLSPASFNGKSSKTDSLDEENNVSAEECSMEDGENGSIDETETKKEENEVHIKDINYPLPPGIWRKGVDFPKSKGIFLRFATRADRKHPNAEKMSEYYKKYGNPNFGGIKGILTESRKRMYKQGRQTKRKLSEDESKDVSDQKHTKNPWGALSESWGVNDFLETDFVQRPDIRDHGRSVKERLGIKLSQKDVAVDDQCESGSSSDSDEEWCKRSKVIRMRMHADDEEEKMHRKRAKLQSKKILDSLNQAGDLRSRLGRRKKESQFRDPIQVVVVNLNAEKPNSSKTVESEEEDGEIKNAQFEEREEGEWPDTDEEMEEEDQNVVENENESDGDSDEPAKEVQGPKGSVIKVVQHRPRVASTVWARLNNIKSEVNNSAPDDRPPRRDLRDALKGGDLRARIGNNTRGRSPLRIEVKNDKYTENDSETE